MELRCPQCDALLSDAETPCAHCGFDPMGGSHPLSEGDLLEDRYRVDAEIGRGGMGVVYRGTDLGLQRPIAIKTLLSAEAEGGQLGRFIREARALASVAHPALVPVYAVGRRENLFYMIMKYVDGRSLDALLREGPLPFERVLPWMRSICGALSALHAQALVHRDIKPSNLMIGPDDDVTVMDLGIVKAVGEQTTSLALGTPRYMAPESLTGGAVDGRADQYALAVVIWQALTGEVPFDAQTTVALLYKQVHERPAPLRKRVSNLPRAFSDAVDRALAKNPADRFPTIDAFLAAAEGEAPTFEKSRLGVLWWALLGVLACGAVAFAFLRGESEQAPLVVDAALPIEETATVVQPEVVQPSPIKQMQQQVTVGATNVSKALRALRAMDAQKPQPGVEKPVMVQVKLQSDPPGAQAYWGKRRLGRTPLTANLPKGTKPLSITFKLDGYENTVVQVDVHKSGDAPLVHLQSMFGLIPPMTP